MTSESNNDGIVNAGDKITLSATEKAYLQLIASLSGLHSSIGKKFMAFYSIKEELLRHKPC